MKRLFLAVVILVPLGVIPPPAEAHVITCVVGASVPEKGFSFGIAIVSGWAGVRCSPPPGPEVLDGQACLYYNPVAEAEGHEMWGVIGPSCTEDAESGETDLDMFPMSGCGATGFYRTALTSAHAFHGNDAWLGEPYVSAARYITCPIPGQQDEVPSAEPTPSRPDTGDSAVFAISAGLTKWERPVQKIYTGAQWAVGSLSLNQLAALRRPPTK